MVPCDRKWYSRLAITELMIEALTSLNMSWPPADLDVDYVAETAFDGARYLDSLVAKETAA